MNSEQHIIEFLREKPCLACGAPGPSDVHHIKSRGSGGTDNPWNVLPLCRKHHSEWHQVGGKKFLKQYADVETYLKALGWETTPKLWHSAN